MVSVTMVLVARQRAWLYTASFADCISPPIFGRSPALTVKPRRAAGLTFCIFFFFFLLDLDVPPPPPLPSLLLLATPPTPEAPPILIGSAGESSAWALLLFLGRDFLPCIQQNTPTQNLTPLTQNLHGRHLRLLLLMYSALYTRYICCFFANI